MSPAEELVDVIDDAGRTIGVTTRARIRAERVPHRCTYVLVLNSHGELFIHLRTPTKDLFPSHWDACIGGVLTAGESYADGVRREVREELGVDVTPCELFPFRYADDRTIVHGMVYRLDHDGPFRLQPEEIVRGEFVTLEEAARRAEREAFCPDGLAVLREFELRHRDSKQA
jgi:isopentenyldiphosphate isomerase